MSGEAFVVRPGDTLIIAYRESLSAAEADEIQAAMRGEQGLGEDVRVLVLDQVAHLAVYRPGGLCASTVNLPFGSAQTTRCALPPGHDGEHQAEQGPDAPPVRWSP